MFCKISHSLCTLVCTRNVKKLSKILYPLKPFLILDMTFIVYGHSILVLVHQSSFVEIKHVFKGFAGLRLKYLIIFIFFKSWSGWESFFIKEYRSSILDNIGIRILYIGFL